MGIVLPKPSRVGDRAIVTCDLNQAQGADFKPRSARIDVKALLEHIDVLCVGYLRIVGKRILDKSKQEQAGGKAYPQTHHHHQRIRGFLHQMTPTESEILKFHAASVT